MAENTILTLLARNLTEPQEFQPPAWCQEVIVVADAAYASRAHMTLTQALGGWQVFALPRTWKLTNGKSLKAFWRHRLAEVEAEIRRAYLDE